MPRSCRVRGTLLLPLRYSPYRSAPQLTFVSLDTLARRRNPTLAAKQIASIDHYSGGRIAINVVSGWFKTEFTAINSPWLEHAERYRRSEEFIKVLRGIWTAEKSFTHHGNFYQVGGSPAGGTLSRACADRRERVPHRRSATAAGQRAIAEKPHLHLATPTYAVQRVSSSTSATAEAWSRDLPSECSVFTPSMQELGAVVSARTSFHHSKTSSLDLSRQ